MLDSGSLSGERAGRELPLEDESFLGYGGLVGRGDSSVGVSESGETRSSENAFGGIAFGGKAGSDLSTIGESLSRVFAWAAALDFFLRLAMSDSWQLMQKMPCDVLAYRRFSIFLLQFRHRKQVAQKAWSPVRIARSSILLLHALQL